MSDENGSGAPPPTLDELEALAWAAYREVVLNGDMKERLAAAGEILEMAGKKGNRPAVGVSLSLGGDFLKGALGDIKSLLGSDAGGGGERDVTPKKGRARVSPAAGEGVRWKRVPPSEGGEGT